MSSAFLGTMSGRRGRPVQVEDGSSFAVASPGGMGESARSLGFLVASLDDAVAKLAAAGVARRPPRRTRPSGTCTTAPDGQLYELVERL